MKHTRLITYQSFAFIYLATIACSTDSSNDDGSGGQSTGGTTSGGTTSTNACEPTGTKMVTNLGSTAYVIDGVNNPNLTLCRNRLYTFDIDATGHPFYIKSVQTTGTGNAYSNGVNGNGATTGTVTFNVPTNAPDTLYYICSIHSTMTGTLHIVD